MKLLEQQSVFLRTHQHQVLASANGVPADCDPPGVAQRIRKQVVGTSTALVRAEVISLVEIDAIDRAVGKELVDVDHVRRSDLERLQLLRRAENVLSLREFVAL